MSGSNRGFWKVIVPLAVGGILLVVLVMVFRPVARTGAVAYAQTNLRRAAEAVELVAAAGSLADADRIRLATEGGVDDLLVMDRGRVVIAGARGELDEADLRRYLTV